MQPFVIYSQLKERFWDKVYVPFDATDEDCWEWMNWKDKDGYGCMTVDSKPKRATHVAWYLYKGYWPKLNLLHKCDCPSCVNPNHLFERTCADNTQDMLSKGRANLTGQTNPNSKLDNTKVIEIKTLLKDGKLFQSQIAKKFGVKEGIISKINCGRNWSHI